MKQCRLLIGILILTLLLTACGTAEGQKNQPQQSTPIQTDLAAETTAQPIPTAEEMPIWSILLSSANDLIGRGDFIYITPTQIMIGQTANTDLIHKSPYNYMTEIEQLQVTEIPEDAFEELCTQLRALRYDLLPGEITRPADHMGIEDASSYYLRIQESWLTSYVSEGYAATHYHEGFAQIYDTVRRYVDAMVRKYTPEAVEPKPIASIALSSHNGYSRLSGFVYLSPTQIATGGMRNSSTVIRSDPTANPGAGHMKVAEIPAGMFEEICARIWTLRFDLLPRKITQPKNKAVSDDSTYYLTVHFEDGTSFASDGYAACYYHERFSVVWNDLSAHANMLMEEYEVPEKEIREIAAVLRYTYNGSAASSGKCGYTFDFYSPIIYLTGQTAVPPTELVSSSYSIDTSQVENAWGDVYTKKFDPLIRELRKLSPQTLPATVEPDPENVIFDGDTQYIVIYFADGTTVTSEGYCASEYNEQFAAVWDLLQRFSVEVSK